MLKHDLTKKSVKYHFALCHKIQSDETQRWIHSFSENGSDFVILDFIHFGLNEKSAFEEYSKYQIENYIRLKKKYGFTVKEYFNLKDDFCFETMRVIKSEDLKKIHELNYLVKNGIKCDLFGKVLKNQSQKCFSFTSAGKKMELLK